MSLHTRTASAFAWNHVARTGEYILVYITSVVLARVLGAETYGAYAVFLSTVQLLITVSSYGLEASIVSNFPRGQGGSRPIGRLLFVRVAGIAIVASIVLLLGYPARGLIALPTVLVRYILVLLLLFFFRNLISFFAAILISTLDTGKMALITLSARLLELSGVVILLSMGKGLSEVFFFITVIAGLQMAAFLPGSRIFRSHVRGREGETSRIIRMGGKFWLNGLLEFILGRQADVILLGLFLVAQDAIGRYDASLALAQGINAGMTAGFMGVATASFAAIAEGDTPALNSHWEYLSRVALFLVVPLLVLVIAAADILMPALYSADFLSGVVFLRIFAASLVATRLLGGGIAANLLSALGRTDLILRSSLVSGAVNLILAVVLIPLTGALGAVVATSAGAITIAAMHARYVHSIAGVSFPWKFGLAVSAVSLLSACAGVLVCAAFPWAGAGGLLAAFVPAFVLLMFIVKPFSAADYAHFRESSAGAASLVRPFSRVSRGPLRPVPPKAR
jgi:O-antigen/teichoic acid export membrane protein